MMSTKQVAGSNKSKPSKESTKAKETENSLVIAREIYSSYEKINPSVYNNVSNDVFSLLFEPIVIRLRNYIKGKNADILLEAKSLEDNGHCTYLFGIDSESYYNKEVRRSIYAEIRTQLTHPRYFQISLMNADKGVNVALLQADGFDILKS